MKMFTKLLMMIGIMASAFVLTAPSAAFAAATDGCQPTIEGSTVTDVSGEECQPASEALSGKILRFVKVLSTLVVVFAVAMIVYGGFKYVTAQGDPKQSEQAKTQIFHAAIGLFIVLAAFTILQLFINASGGI